MFWATVTVMVTVVAALGERVTEVGLKEKVIPDPGRPVTTSVRQQVERVTLPEYPFRLVIVTGMLAVTGITFWGPTPLMLKSWIRKLILTECVTWLQESGLLGLHDPILPVTVT